MRTTMDNAGRVVIPKPVRDAAGITPGSELEIEVRDGRIEIELPVVEMKLATINGLPVIQAPAHAGKISARVTDALRRSLRSERENRIVGNTSRR